MTKKNPARERIELWQYIEAYKAYIEGKPLDICAAVSGVTDRTIRTWAENDDWKSDKAAVKGLVRALVIAEHLRDFINRTDRENLIRSCAPDAPADTNLSPVCPH